MGKALGERISEMLRKQGIHQMQLPIWQLHYTQRPIIFWELRTMRSTITRFAV